MYRYISIASLILISIQLQSQKPSLDLQSELESEGQYLHKLIYQKGNSLYTVGYIGDPFKTKEFFVSEYSTDDFRRLEHWRFKGFEYKKNKAIYWKSFGNEEGIHLFFLNYDKRNDRKYLLHRLVDPEGNLGPVKEIVAVNSKRKYDATFTIIYSSDSSKIAVFYEFDDKQLHEIYSVVVFDYNLEELWNRSLTSPFENGEIFKPLSNKLSNDGTLFILGYRVNEKERKSEIGKTELYGIIRVDDEGYSSHDFAPLGKVIHIIDIKLDEQGKLLAVGLSADNQSSEVFQSLFVVLDSKSLHPVLAHSDSLSSNTLKLIERREYSKPKGSGKTGFDGFKLNEFFLHENGKITVIGNRFYKRSYERSGMWFNYYYYEEILIMQFDEQGNQLWSSLVPRFQECESFVHLGSYFSYLKDNTLHLIFNDIYTNKERLKEGTAFQVFNRSLIGAGTVDVLVDLNSGGLNYEVLTISNEVGDCMVAPSEMLRMNNSEAIGVYHDFSGRKDRFVKFRF